MSDVVDSESLEVRARWKKIARKDKGPDVTLPGVAELHLGVAPTSESYYLLYQNRPYCIYEGSVYEMLPVEDPSLGYKLVDAMVDRKTVLAKAKGITEVQALDVMFISCAKNA